MSVYEDIIDSAVDKKCHNGEAKRNLYHLHTSQRCQQKLGNRKKQIREPYDIQILHTLLDDVSVSGKNTHCLEGKQTDQHKQKERHHKPCMHSCGCNLFHGFRLLFPPILAAEDHKPVSQCHKDLLKYKLDLIDRCHACQ